jgi:hypothetical protein
VGVFPTTFFLLVRFLCDEGAEPLESIRGNGGFPSLLTQFLFSSSWFVSLNSLRLGCVGGTAPLLATIFFSSWFVFFARRGADPSESGECGGPFTTIHFILVRGSFSLRRGAEPLESGGVGVSLHY